MEAEDTAVDVLPMPARPAEVDAVGRLKLLAGVAEAELLRTFEELIGREVDGLAVVAVLMRLGLELEQVAVLKHCIKIASGSLISALACITADLMLIESCRQTIFGLFVLCNQLVPERVV